MRVWRYVVGFMFSADLGSVVLIRKTKPAWQRGKLNGVGGKINDGEGPLEAMLREFEEEAGVKTYPTDWSYFLKMSGKNDGDGEDFSVDFFACIGDPTLCRSCEEESIETVGTNFIRPLREDMIENLPWLIALAIDHLQDGRPYFVEASYH